MKFEFNWQNGFWVNYALIFDETPKWPTLAKRSKGNYHLWYLSLVMNISIDYNDFGFNSFQKNIF